MSKQLTSRSDGKRVFIGIPLHAGELNAATSQTLLNHGTARPHEVRVDVQGLSLLARNFNTLFLQAYHGGYDYFMLMHGDIGISSATPPGRYWLDTMIDIVSKLNAAAVAAVSPIKSLAGHTSLALQMDSSNPYGLKRATLKQIARARPLITREELCRVMGQDPTQVGAMLINTAFLIMNLRAYDWTKWSGFEIQDSIVWNSKGIGQTFTKPEDWKMSLDLARLGWPYYATKALELHHMGQFDYHTGLTIGEESDSTPVQMSPEQWSQT